MTAGGVSRRASRQNCRGNLPSGDKLGERLLHCVRRRWVPSRSRRRRGAFSPMNAHFALWRSHAQGLRRAAAPDPGGSRGNRGSASISAVRCAPFDFGFAPSRARQRAREAGIVEQGRARSRHTRAGLPPPMRSRRLEASKLSITALERLAAFALCVDETPASRTETQIIARGDRLDLSAQPLHCIVMDAR